MNSIFSLSFWFEYAPTAYKTATIITLFTVFLITIGIAIYATWQIKNQKKQRLPIQAGFFSRLASACYTMGIIGLILAFFSYERVALLGSRFWYIFWVIAFGVWIYFIIRYKTHVIPEKIKNWEARIQNNKYLPK